MAVVTAEIRFAPKDAAWVAANASTVFANGEVIYRSTDGKYVIPDGVTALSGLTWYGGVSASGLTVGTTTITGGTNTKVLYNNNGVVGEYTVTGSGNVVLSSAPTSVNHIITPSNNATEYALRLTDDGSGINNPDLEIDSIYNARIKLKNNNTSVTWYLTNNTLSTGEGVDSFTLGTSTNPASAFFAIDSTGRTNVRSGMTLFKPSFLTSMGHVPQMTNGNPTTSLSYTTDQVTLTPFILNEDMTITELNFLVWNNVAGKSAAVGIYEWDESTHNVGTLIVTSGLISCATIGLKTYSFTAVKLKANRKYLMAYINDDSTIRIYSTNYNSISYLPINSSNAQQYSVLTKTISAGWTALPSSLTADGGRVQLSPIVGMK